MAATLAPTLSTPELTAVEQEGLILAGQAEDLVIDTDEDFRAAGLFLVNLKTYQKRVTEIFAPVVKATHEAHKAAVAQREKLLAGATEAERILKAAVVTYERQQSAGREALRRQQEAIAHQQADLSREATATALEQAGQTQAAEAVRAAPAAPVVLPPAPPAPSAPGLSFREHWSAEVTDLKALVQAVAAGSQPLDLLLPNDAALNALARSLKSSLQIPGVRATCEHVPAVSTR